MKIINRCFSRRTIEEIISTLESKALDKKDDWISSTIQSLKKASPTSLKISLRSIREGRLQGVGSCLVREYRMACHVLKGEFSKDVHEVEYAIFQPPILLHYKTDTFTAGIQSHIHRQG
uniref:3-hydroxyisobutyryl-CoA hydrolase n=1 Tax=Solanum tuberosum TaxID=4113 RepID=M1CFJ4_SOLTU